MPIVAETLCCKIPSTELELHGFVSLADRTIKAIAVDSIENMDNGNGFSTTAEKNVGKLKKRLM